MSIQLIIAKVLVWVLVYLIYERKQNKSKQGDNNDRRS